MWVSAIFLWACIYMAAASVDVITLYKKVGDEVVLQPSPGTKPTKTILWKSGSDIAVQWDENGVDKYRQFEARGELNLTNGALTITGLVQGDSAVFSPEIDSRILAPIKLVVILPVPKPAINESCDEEMTSCDLTCDGNTTGADPVTYKWRSRDKEPSGSSKKLHITKDNTSMEFSCELENPVSKESSPFILNPLITDKPIIVSPSDGPKMSTGLTVLISLLGAVLVLVLLHRWKAGAWFFQKDSMPWDRDFWCTNQRQSTVEVEANSSPTWEREAVAEETVG